MDDLQPVTVRQGASAAALGETDKTMPDGVVAGGKQVLSYKTFAYLVLSVSGMNACAEKGIGADKKRLLVTFDATKVIRSARCNGKL
jgi:hypothetical protein